MATFRTTEGLDVIIRPVSMLLMQRVRQAVEAEKRSEGATLTPPTYTVTTATGQTETFEHDDESAAADAVAKEALAKYRSDTATLEREVNRRSQRLFFSKGIKVEGVPESWLAEMREEGLPVAEDPAERRLEYIQMELLKTPADIKGAIQAIMVLSMAGAPAEDLAAVQASFRDTLGPDAAGDGAPPAA